MGDDFFASGVLALDLYVLLLESSVLLEVTEDAFASGGAGYGFDFRVVPEPASGPLLLAGLVLLARRRRARAEHGKHERGFWSGR